MALEWNNTETVYSMWRVISGTATQVSGNNTSNADLFPDNFAVGDYLAFNKAYAVSESNDFKNGSHKFQGLEFNIDVAIAATGYTYAWEYYDKHDSSWHALSGVVDNTNGLTSTGTNSVKWTIPTNFEYSYKQFNNSYGATGMMVRIVVTGLTSATEGGHQSSSVDIKDYSYAIWIKDGNTYTPQEIHSFASGLGLSITTQSTSTKNVLLNANLIITNGKLHIYDHTVFTVGKTRVY
jgi:hypothetical protein